MFKSVRIPIFNASEIVAVSMVEIFEFCPVCKGPRGQVMTRLFWEEQKVFECDGWQNPCGHIDNYDQVKNEARQISAYNDLMNKVCENIIQNVHFTNNFNFGVFSEQDTTACANLITNYINQKTGDISVSG
ncbi:MAG: hypothetical protein OEX83_05465 [Gammaproteobacteria bacterium]|nr:hypothetical protein [Gammaproteobacteria bacterium]